MLGRLLLYLSLTLSAETLSKITLSVNYATFSPQISRSVLANSKGKKKKKKLCPCCSVFCQCKKTSKHCPRWIQVSVLSKSPFQKRRKLLLNCFLMFSGSSVVLRVPVVQKAENAVELASERVLLSWGPLLLMEIQKATRWTKLSSVLKFWIALYDLKYSRDHWLKFALGLWQMKGVL